MDYIDYKYVNLLSSRFQQYKIRSTHPFKAQFRCPYCGDSQKSKTKSRGWIIEDQKKNTFGFFCYNCRTPRSAYQFMKDQDPMIFRDWLTERFASNGKQHAEMKAEDVAATPKFDQNPLRKIKKISQLAPDHPAKQYIVERQIPPEKHYLIYYAPKFKRWINSIIPNKFDPKKIGKDEPRIILPFFDEEGQIFGVAARGFDPNGLRYISIMFDETKDKVFGLSTIDWNRKYYIVEGAIDSFFLNNCLAMAGSSGGDGALKCKQNAVYVFDNEPRNIEIHKQMQRHISAGDKICIWPSHIEQKDINAMHLGGVKNIQLIIDQNTFKGLEAELRLKMWRKAS